MVSAVAPNGFAAFEISRLVWHGHLLAVSAGVRNDIVRQALDDVGYNGWLTIEDGGIPLAEFNQRLDLIIAGHATRVTTH